MARFIEKLRTIEAIQIRQDNWDKIREFIADGSFEFGLPKRYRYFKDGNIKELSLSGKPDDDGRKWCLGEGLKLPVSYKSIDTNDFFELLREGDWLVRNRNGDLCVNRAGEFESHWEYLSD